MTTTGDRRGRIARPGTGVSLAGISLGTVLTVVFLAAPVAGPGDAQTSSLFVAALATLASDPAGQGAGIGGFSRNHWITSRDAMLSVFGAGEGPRGDNSLRLYDPVRNRWEYVWPAGRGGVPKRDNHGSLYVPALDEFWIWDGSYLHVSDYRSGRFSFKTSTWVAQSTDIGGAFAGVVRMPDGVITQGINGPACAWSEALDMGLVGFGSRQGNPTGEVYLIERNPAGPERYRVTQLAGVSGTPGGPPPRTMVYGALVAAGKDFYLMGTQNGGGRPVSDFWRFDGVARKWTRLADPPAVGWAPSLTYDSELDVVLAWVGARLFVYDIATGRWYDVTPPGLPNVSLQMAVYAPTAKLHIFEGGNLTDRPFNGVIGVRLARAVNSTSAPAPVSSLGVAPPASEPAPADAPNAAPASPPAPVAAPSSAPDRRVALPLKTWVKVPLPPSRQGPCTAPYGCKHVRGAVNLRSGRIYFFGGDYERPPYPALFSYSVLGNDWAIEYPACGPAGEISPWIPDQVAWAYDSRRNLFYWTGGFHWGPATSVTPDCGPGQSRRTGPALTFDPTSRKWSVSPFGAQPTAGSSKTAQFSVYDPKTDTVIHLGQWSGNNGAILLHVGTNRWEGLTLSRTDNGMYINDGDWAEDNQPAIDIEGRAVYLVDRGPEHKKPRLLRYNIDRKTMTYLGPTPQTTDIDIPLLAFDSINRVLYWLTAREAPGSRIWVYHPDPTGGTRGRWEKIDMMTPDGVQARGNVLVFDPTQNALLLMGGVNWNNEPDPSYNRYLFLYRYGDGEAGCPWRQSADTESILSPAPVWKRRVE